MSLGKLLASLSLSPLKMEDTNTFITESFQGLKMLIHVKY